MNWRGNARYILDTFKIHIWQVVVLIVRCAFTMSPNIYSIYSTVCGCVPSPFPPPESSHGACSALGALCTLAIVVLPSPRIVVLGPIVDVSCTDVGRVPFMSSVKAGERIVAAASSFQAPLPANNCTRMRAAARLYIPGPVKSKRQR